MPTEKPQVRTPEERRISVSERFKILINGLKLTRAELASQLGVRPQTIGDYCSGKSYPSAKILILLAEQYEVNTNWLLTGTGEMHANPQSMKENTAFSCMADALRDIVYGELDAAPERFARAGGITPQELAAILDRKMSPPATALRNWAIRYRINMNFLIAQIGYPLLTRGQYEQDGPLMPLRRKNRENKYPEHCDNPDYAQDAESLGSPPPPPAGGEDAHGRFLPNMSPSGILPPGTEIPIIGLAQCGLSGWSASTKLAVATSSPLLRQGVLAAMAIGDSMLPAGIQSGNIVYCDPWLPPQKGDPVLVRRKGLTAQTEGDATLKLWEGRDADWIYLRGWLPRKEGQPQQEFTIQQSLAEVVDIAPVTLVRRRA